MFYSFQSSPKTEDLSFAIYLKRKEDVLLKSRMREIFTSGSVRGLIATLGLLPQQKAGYELYSTEREAVQQ